MKILHVSALSSNNLIKKLYNKTHENPGFAVQKFNRLFVNGLISNACEVTALTNPPITKNYSKQVVVNIKNECENGILYHYIPFINVPILRHIGIFFYSFFYTLFWSVWKNKEKAVICDVLTISSCMGSLLAAKITRVKTVGVVTDIYSQMVGNPTSGIRLYVSKLAGFLNRKYVSSFTYYVLLTDEMNAVVNLKNRPYIVMEALCDSSLILLDIPKKQKVYPRVVLYAGGLEKRYGLKMLVDAFKVLNLKDVQLHIYGSGSYAEELKYESEQMNSIIYKGVRSNEEIINAEMSATLLVNPRFTTEEFTKYSFPSKNMEYMVSGTPLLTTNLPGMPKEYHDHVYLFEEETVYGYARKLSNVLSLSSEQLEAKGNAARRFVLEQKNNIIQTARILSLIS